jgi:transcriptional regulator with XRE-family HTH domain
MQAQANPGPSREEINRRRLGRNIAAARQQAELTQRQLSKRVSKSQPFISRLERGRDYPRMETLVRIASALRVPPADLLAGVE